MAAPWAPSTREECLDAIHRVKAEGSRVLYVGGDDKSVDATQEFIRFMALLDTFPKA